MLLLCLELFMATVNQYSSLLTIVDLINRSENLMDFIPPFQFL